MQTYLNGQAITLAIPLIIEDEACLDVSAVEYRIFDHTGAELVARESLTSFTSGDAQAIVAISGIVNSLATNDQKRALRIVELYLTTVGGEVQISHPYVVVVESILELGVNSFQSYYEGVLLSLDIPNLPNFANADRSSREIAMIGAWRNIGGLYLRYIDEANMTRLITPWAESGNVTELTADQFNALPEKMTSAIRRAQVIEADHLLTSDDDIAAIRQQGVIGETVGESSRLFSPGKPYEGICGKRTLKELSKYIVRLNKLARG